MGQGDEKKGTGEESDDYQAATGFGMAQLVDRFESTSSVFGGVLGGHGGWLVGLVVEGALGWTHVGCWVPGVGAR